VSQVVGTLIRSWFELGESRSEYRVIAVREALGRAAVITGAIGPDYVISRIRAEIGAPGEKIRRIPSWTICREWIRNGDDAVWSAVRTWFETSESPEIVAEIGEIVLRPLASDVSEVFKLLLKSASVGSESDNRGRVALLALSDAVTSLNSAREALSALGIVEGAPVGHQLHVLRFLGRCAHAMTEGEQDRVLNDLPNNLDLTPIVGGFQPVPSAFLNQVVARALATASRVSEEALAKHLVLLSPALSPIVRTAAVHWLSRQLDSKRRQIPRIASEALRILLPGVEPALWHRVVEQVAAHLENARDDAHRGAHGYTLSAWLQNDAANERDFAAAARSARAVLAREGVGREGRKGVFAMLKELARVDPVMAEEEVAVALAGLGKLLGASERVTDDLAGIGQVVYFISRKDPGRAWPLARRVIGLGERAKLGRGGWDRVSAVCSGTVRSGLDDEQVRPQIIRAIVELPNIVQAMVVRCARDQDRSEVFHAIARLKVSPAASVEVEQWGHDRSGAAAGSS
jgi:hypothetical protein